MTALERCDPEVFELVRREEQRQQNVLSLIPSENFFSPAVREAVGSVFMHKYAEGNLGRRYYEGCEHADALEALAIERARRLFRLPEGWGVNVQALSGSNANVAVYLAALSPQDTILSLYLPDGGHLSHGWSYEPGVRPDPAEMVYAGGSRKVTLVSRLFRVVQYKTDPVTQQINYEALEELAVRERPKLLVTGGTAYPRLIDHRRMRAIAEAVGALYLADIAHEAGLVGAGVIPSPVGVADVVTLTTHKTLRSGRGAIILSRGELAAHIDKAVLPGLQGGPHLHNLAGICVGLGEALRPSFGVYARAVVANTQALAAALLEQGFTLVTGGGDKHLLLLDLRGGPLLGKRLARALAGAGIVTNYNTMPQEVRPPTDPSALRLGTPWVTTRGMGPEQMRQIAAWAAAVQQIAAPWRETEWADFEAQVDSAGELARIASAVQELCALFPLPAERAPVTAAAV